jgi:riboflavin kinase / FMN adenylyltransferase
MRIVRGLESYRADTRPTVVALGVFDGVHLAHRAILTTAVTGARAADVTALACTFDRHPAETLQPDRAPAPITTLEERLGLISETGVDATIVLSFTREFAAIEAEAFVKEILLGRLRAREVVVGFNHRFGRGARGDARLLEDMAESHGFQARVIPPMELDGIAVSSTEIRAALQRGDVGRAARLLGRPYGIAGTVTAGAGRGRTLGFPTANVAADRQLLLPNGVYFGRMTADGRPWPAVVNIGVRPTFGETTVAIEAHLLNFSGDLYGRPVRLDFLDRIRDEKRFGSVDELKAQIAQDIAVAQGRRPSG